MDRLKGKTILIGKEPNEGRLSVALIDNGAQKSIAIREKHSVPNSVSRCIPSKQTGHCKIDVDMTGKMVITNLKDANVTFVDNIQVESKKIDSSNTVLLGKDKYKLDLDLILHTAVKLAIAMTQDEESTPKEYSIKHLEYVWKEYEESIETIQRNQQKRVKWRMIPMMIGSASTLIAAICAVTIGNSSLFITIPIAAVSFIIYLLNYFKKDTSIEDRKKATNNLFDNYICPNPKCNHFLGNQPYRILKQNKKCPYCGCPFTSD